MIGIAAGDRPNDQLTNSMRDALSIEIILFLALSEKKDVIETPSILKVTSYPSTLVSMAITSSPSTEPTVMVTPSYKEPGMTPVPTSVPKPLTDSETHAIKQSKTKGDYYGL